ncbi:Uncharacterised protein [Elizabethkingia miricola]|nr:Uncharacterised protein [Elizabethkingia miricola]
MVEAAPDVSGCFVQYVMTVMALPAYVCQEGQIHIPYVVQTDKIIKPS